MESTPNPEFIFWIHPWKKILFFRSSINNRRVIKCTVNNAEIKTEEPIFQHEFPLKIRLEDIDYVRFGSLNGESICEVVVETTNMKSYYLVPTNPFDPSLIFYSNEAEAKVMYQVIDRFQQGEVPSIEKNPYLRQLNQKYNPKYLANVNEVWDANISPRIYSLKYNESILRKIKVWEAIFRIGSILFLVIGIIYIFWMRFVH